VTWQCEELEQLKEIGGWFSHELRLSEASKTSSFVYAFPCICCFDEISCCGDLRRVHVVGNFRAVLFLFSPIHAQSRPLLFVA